MISFDHLIGLSNVLVLPAFLYIILLERRITKMQVQIENLIKTMKGDHD